MKERKKDGTVEQTEKDNVEGRHTQKEKSTYGRAELLMVRQKDEHRDKVWKADIWTSK